VRALTVVALMAAVAGFTLSVMASLSIKTPTWDGEGRETTLVLPVVCAFVQCLCVLAAVVLWQLMVNEYDTACRIAMRVEDFACISSTSSHKVAMADVVFALATYVLWRTTHAYHARIVPMSITTAITSF
jgi:hypothetical protein